jgi:hypothetical protein
MQRTCLTDWLYLAPAFFSLTEPNVLQAQKRQDSRNHQDKAQNDGIIPDRVVSSAELTTEERVNELIHSAFTTFSLRTI